MCGDDPADPDINKDDVNKDKGNALSDGITPTDGHESLKFTGEKPRLLEAFETRTFEDVWPDVSGIKKDAAPTSVDSAWRSVGDQLHTSALAFEREVTRLKGAGGWEGKTIEAAFTNAIESISEPFYTGTAALRGAELVHKFRDTMNYVYENLVKDPLGEKDNMWERYQFDLNNDTEPIEGAPGQQSYYYEPTTEAQKAAIRQYYNEYMRLVMNDSYKPGINDIYGGYPQFVQNTAPAQPIEIPGLPQDPGKPKDESGGSRSTGDGGGTPSFDGGGLPSRGGAGTPSIPKTPGPSLPTGLPDQTQLPSPGDSNNPGQSTDQGQNGRPSLTDPSQAMGQAGGLANAANQAMGAATQAASQAAKAPPNGLPKDLGKKPNVPEGALRLGKEGQGSGARGGGGNGGASLGGPSKGLPSGLPGMPAAATQASAAGASGPGMGAGSPMMGPPGTPGSPGHGAGGAQQGKEHKVNKALRSRRHGIEIAGEAEAVVPVVGQDQDQEQQQDAAAAQRGPDRPRRPSTPSPAAPVSAAEHEGRQLRGRG